MLQSLIMKVYASHSKGNCNSPHQRTRHILSLRLKEGRGHYCLTCNVYHPKSKAEGGQRALLSHL